MYEEVIGPRRKDPIRLLEVGIFLGRSIEAWLDWLPNATITALDTFERRPPEEVPVLKDPRVRWFRKNSTGKAPQDIRTDGGFDFIVDDGCHWHCAQQITFFRYWPMLKPGGSYFIEDVWPFDMMSDEDKQHPWIRKHPGAWTDGAFRSLLDEVEKAGAVRRHDFRRGENSDRYVLEIRK